MFYSDVCRFPRGVLGGLVFNDEAVFTGRYEKRSWTNGNQSSSRPVNPDSSPPPVYASLRPSDSDRPWGEADRSARLRHFENVQKPPVAAFRARHRKTIMFLLPAAPYESNPNCCTFVLLLGACYRRRSTQTSLLLHPSSPRRRRFWRIFKFDEAAPFTIALFFFRSVFVQKQTFRA